MLCKISKLWICAALLCLLATSAVPVLAQQNAELLNTKANLACDIKQIKSAVLLDDNRSTKIAFDKNSLLTIEISQSVHSLYLVWDTSPGTFSVELDAQSITGGENGFIHEFIQLPSPQTKIKLQLNASTLCDIYLFGEGQAPEYVQKWQPPYNDADMLLLPTHADDEHLFFGGTMPYYSADKKLQVAYMTNHWGEAYRPHELLDGLWTVGITAYPIISDFKDAYANSLEQAKRIYDEAEVTAFQVELIRRFKPEVVIAHDINGEYGHGAHMLNAATLQSAVELAMDETQMPQSAQQYGIFKVLKTYLHLWPQGEIVMDWDTPLKHFENKTALDMAIEGFAKHTSQQKYFKVEAFGPYDCRKFGLYKSEVGADILKNDLFENVTSNLFSDYVIEPTPTPSPIISEAPSSMPALPNSEPIQPQKQSLQMAIITALILLAVATIIIVLKRRK